MNLALSQNVIALVDQEGPLVLSEMFLELWTGKRRPPEELEAWLSDRGFEIFPSTEWARPGWRVQRKQEPLIGGLFTESPKSP